MRGISLSRRVVSPSQDHDAEPRFVHREEPSARVMWVWEAWWRYLPLFIWCSPTLQYHQHRCPFYKQKCSVGWIGGLLWLAAEWRVSAEKLKSYWSGWLGECSNGDQYDWYSEVKWATAQAVSICTNTDKVDFSEESDNMALQVYFHRGPFLCSAVYIFWKVFIICMKFD